MSHNSKDGLELVIKCLSWIPIWTTVLFPSAGLYAIHNDLPVVRFLNPDLGLGVNSLITLVITYLGIFDWVCITPLMIVILLHTNATGKWLAKAKETW